MKTTDVVVVELTYDEDGRVRKQCCYEMLQRGEGKNAEHILKRNIAAIVADIAYPVSMC